MAIWEIGRTALRALRSRAWMSCFAALVLGGALAVVVVVGSVTWGVVGRSLPYQAPDRLVMFGPGARGVPVLSTDEYRMLRRLDEVFESVGGSAVGPLAYGGDNPDQRLGRAWQVTGSLFEVLRTDIVVGRSLRETDEAAASHVAVLAYGAWLRWFGGDPGVVGRTIRLGEAPDSKLVQIVGVAGPGFAYPEDVGPVAWVPLGTWLVPSSPRSAYLQVAARLREGVTIETAQRRVGSSLELERTSEQVPGGGSETRPRLMTFERALVGDVEQWLVLVICASGLLLGVAILTVAGLKLAEISERSSELSIRSALGASALALRATVLTETVSVAAVAGLVAWVLASWGVAVTAASLAALVPRAGEIGLSTPMVLAVAAVSGLTGLATGWVPSHLAVRQGALSPSGAVSATAPRSVTRWRSLLVSSAVALLCCLSVTCMAFVLGFARLMSTDLGFSPSGLFAVELRRGADRMVSLDAVGGIQAAWAAGAQPLLMDAFGGDATFVSVACCAGGPRVAEVTARLMVVSPEYLRTMQIPVVAGPGFVGQRSGRGQAVIDEILAVRLFGTAPDAIGAEVAVATFAAPLPVVGVARAVRPRGPEQAAEAQLYVVNDARLAAPTHLVVRGAGALPDLERVLGLRGGVSSDGGSPPRVLSFEAALERLTAGRQAIADVMAVLGVAALVLVSAALYSMALWIVRTRQRSIAIHMALGAGRRQVAVGLWARVLTVVVPGVALGAAAGYLLATAFSSLIVGIRPHDWAIYAGVIGIVLATSVMSSLVPITAVLRQPLRSLLNET